MPLPFPGMDPYLESPELWSEVHNRLMVAIAILVARGNRRPAADLYAFTLREPLPTFPLPLERLEEEPAIELQQIFAGVYDRAGFDLAINYQNPPLLKLNDIDAQWATQILNC